MIYVILPIYNVFVENDMLEKEICYPPYSRGQAQGLRERIK